MPLSTQRQAVEKKIADYQGKYDPGTFEFIALALELNGRPSKSLEKFMRRVGQKAAEQNRTQEPREPRQYEKQFTYKWTMRMITAVRKAMTRRANNHMFRLMRQSKQ